MHIQNVTLFTHAFEDQIAFYGGQLGLPMAREGDAQFVVTVGTSTLTFRRTDTPKINHMAFNIPEHQFQQALDWAADNVTLLPHEGKPYVDFSDSHWEAHSLYFEDAAGNVLEFIARHRLPAPDAPDAFDATSVQCISEVGFAADDVSRVAQPLQTALDAPVFSGDLDGSFCALGDDHGLLICVEAGRMWLPTDNRPSMVAPVSVTVAGDRDATHDIDGYPYQVIVASGA